MREISLWQIGAWSLFIALLAFYFDLRIGDVPLALIFLLFGGLCGLLGDK